MRPASLCVGCGRTFRPTGQNQKRCQRDCGRRRKPHRLKGICSDCGQPRRKDGGRCKPCSNKRPRRRTLVLCLRCDQPHWPWRNRVRHALKFCSGARCVEMGRERKYRRAGWKGPARRVAAGLQRVPRDQRTCLRCLMSFTPRSARQTCCSTACRWRYESARRKLRLRGLSPEPISVIVLHRRDGGRCSLCRRHVNLGLKYPHPRSATIDHIVPITMGGENTYQNAQLAHARCNTAKGNHVCGSQLRLIG